MRNSSLVVVLVLAVLLLASWPVNLIKFIGCDFKAPYKAEIIRGIGIPIVPVGVVAAYLPLGK